MVHAIMVLVRARLQVLRNSFWRGKLAAKVGTVALIALLAFGAFGLYSFVRFLVRLLRDPEVAEVLAEAAEASPGLPLDIEPYLAALPGALLLGALAILLLSSFGALLNTLYLSGDTDMLLVAPVPMRAVFVVKFFSALSTLYLLLFGLLGPALLGYGQGMGYGPLYALTAILVLLLLPFIPAGLAALLVMGVVRVLPARRAREIVGVLGGMVGVLFYIVSQFADEIAPSAESPASLGALLASNFPLLPSAWAGRALVAAGEGQALPLLVYGGIFVGASLGIFAGCLLLSERLYYDGWANVQAEGGRAKKPEPGQRRADVGWRESPLLSWLPRQSRAILVKDLRLFVRDLRNLQQVIFPLALAGIWIFQLFVRPPDTGRPGDAPAWVESFAGLASVGIAFYICLALSSGLAGSGINREGRAFWAIKLAPISTWRLLLGKFALAYLPYPTIGLAFLILLSVLGDVGPADFLRQLGLLLVAGTGCVAISLGIGAAFPRLDWENPQQQNTFRSGCLGTIALPIYVGLMLLLIGGAGALGAAFSLAGPAAIGLELAGWLLAIALTASVCALTFSIGARGIEGIEV